MRLGVLLSLVFLTLHAHAEESVKVRIGSHDGFDRVVFEFTTPTSYELERTPDGVTLHFNAAGQIPSLKSDTAAIKTVTGGDSTASIVIEPGYDVRSMQLDRRVVLDVRRATVISSPSTPGAAAVKPRPMRAAKTASPLSTPKLATPPPADTAKSGGASPIPAIAQPTEDAKAATGADAITTPAPSPTTNSVTPSAPAAAPPASVGGSDLGAKLATAEPISIAAIPLDEPTQLSSSSILLPFSQDVGAAAFQRGSEAWVVFDEARPVEASSFQDQPAFARATVQVLAAGTLLRFPLRDGDAVGLRRVNRGWIVTAGPPNSPALPPLLPSVHADHLLFPVATTGQVVNVADGSTGQNLEIGTLRAAGPGVPVPFRAPEFNILPSWQGVAAELLSDRASLRDLPDGISVDTGAPLSATPDSARALADAAVLTRRFDFPALPVQSLLHRLQSQMADEGAAPAQGRLLPRKAAAQTMLALGLGAEAESLLHLAQAEDPHASDDPDMQGLLGIAALMSGRPSEADGLLNAGLDGSDEISLWRAALAATRHEGSPEAASLFATTTKLILSYPAALRNRLLPLAAETMASGGAPAAADALLDKRPDDPRLAFARAIRLEDKGDAAGALTLLDALAVGRDRLVSARAGARATRLRLATHAIGPAEAADELERRFLDWRGDTRERDLRVEVVKLRAQVGQWRRAFNLVKETTALYPDDQAMFHNLTTQLLTTLLHGNGAAAISPLDLVTLAEENAEEAAKLAPDEVTALLADRLVALDLPKQAAPVIERMLVASAPGNGRASLGARLAAMLLAEGDLDKAEAALVKSDAPDLSPNLLEERGMIEARLRAKRHDVAGAASLLANLNSAGADDLRATILADAGDWHGAEAALKSLVERVIPAAGSLTPNQQDIVLRLASAQAHAGDDEGARELGIRETARMVGPRADLFRVLTAAPLNGIGDLGRSAGELAMARAIPASLAAVGSR